LNTPLKIRCSSLPRLAACAAAIEPPGITIEGDRGPSDLGTAFHAAMVTLVIRGTWPDVEALAHEHRVDEGELAGLVGMARKAWEAKLSEMFPEPETELELSADDVEAGITLTGHADLVSRAGPEIRILDYKSGWLDQDATEQLKGYALLALLKSPDCATARVSKWQIRHGTLSTQVYTRDELELWWKGFSAHIRETGIYRPGSHCGYCPRAMECGARRTVLSMAVDTFRDVSAADVIPDQSPESLARIVAQARSIAKLAEAAIEAVRAEVKLRGGEYGPLRLIEQERREIDASRSFDVLREVIGEEALLEVTRVSKTAVEKIVKDTAPRGQKGKRVELLMAKLEEIGALKLTTIEKLEITNGSRIIAATTSDNAGTSAITAE
jgi:hypothetical protein